VRGSSIAIELVPGAVLGTLLLVTALARGETPLGWALGVGGATYVGAAVYAGRGVDAIAPLVAVLLMLCGELTAWSLDERWRIGSEDGLEWRRAGALAALAFSGLAASTLVVALSAAPPGHGLAWTAAGAAAAVGAAGTGIWLARRQIRDSADAG
jgi:hypothetical protein